MAAGSFTTNFQSDINLNGKRRYDDNDMNDYDLFVPKRRNLTLLPIRSPPRPSIAITPAFGHFGIYPGTLTPDSIPEDDEQRSYGGQEFQRCEKRPHSNSNTSSNGSLCVNVDSKGENMTDVDMDISSPKQSSLPTPGRIGRARSNDLLSPLRPPSAPHSLSPTTGSFARDRMPTPVTSSFPGRSPFDSSFASAAARQMRSQLSSTLSPMVDAESWTPKLQRPPSPEPELDAPFDEDAMMIGAEDSRMMNSSFSSLSVHSREQQDTLPELDSSPIKNWSSQTSPSPKARGLGLDGAENMRPDELRMSTFADARTSNMQHGRNQSNGRTARLHMGFRADCEKCVARVPGHYSHIFWS